jgi:hypothetical protein
MISMGLRTATAVLTLSLLTAGNHARHVAAAETQEQKLTDQAMEIIRLGMGLLGARDGMDTLCGWRSHGDLKFATEYMIALTPDTAVRGDIFKPFMAFTLSAVNLSFKDPAEKQKYCDDTSLTLNKKADDAKEMLLVVKQQGLGTR